MGIKNNIKQVIWLVISGLMQVSLSGLDLSDSRLKRAAPTDTVVVYDTVFEFVPLRRFPRSYVISAIYMPQNVEERYGTWRATWGYELYEMNSYRLDANRRFALDAKSMLRYRFLRADLEMGLGLHYYQLKFHHNYYDYYRDEYISNIRHVFENGGIIDQSGEFLTVGPQLNVHLELGNFKKVKSRLTVEANAGLYAYASILSNESFSYAVYDRHWIWYDNGVREIVSETMNFPRVLQERGFNSNDINYHVDVRLKCRVMNEWYVLAGLGYNGLTYNPFSNSNTTLGLQYRFGTKYNK